MILPVFPPVASTPEPALLLLESPSHGPCSQVCMDKCHGHTSTLGLGMLASFPLTSSSLPRSLSSPPDYPLVQTPLGASLPTSLSIRGPEHRHNHKGYWVTLGKDTWCLKLCPLLSSPTVNVPEFLTLGQLVLQPPQSLPWGNGPQLSVWDSWATHVHCSLELAVPSTVTVPD